MALGYAVAVVPCDFIFFWRGRGAELAVLKREDLAN
jgi:hypothetical protein